MRHHHLILLPLLGFHLAHADDEVPFLEAKPEQPDDPTIAIELKASEKLYIKSAQELMVMSVSDVKYEEKEERLTEACTFTLIKIDHAHVTTKSFTSAIIYGMEIFKNGGRHLTTLEGTQEFREAGIEFAWSHSTEDAVYIYFPPRTKYAVVTMPEKKVEQVEEADAEDAPE